ncbi:AAA family ATPase [Streptomyces sp. WAC 06783]|uniref:ATP-binding protein n=1 Tax=Streptomyces sp. WAC 06783 TaxID=2203211 RepID=UPI0021AD5D23|nr:LuxR family transcriptional regulator [Streptomyces sp. WAC 06783]
MGNGPVGTERVGIELVGTGHDGTELVGRQSERVLLQRALDDARSGAGGSTTVLRGDPGIGKTALLDWVAARAGRDGFTVLWAGGDEAGTGIAFGALHQVLRPLLEHVRALPRRQRAALESALGLCDPAFSDGLMVGASVLALLAEETRRRPVLVLVDDLHWVDSSSAAVLVFLRQRIADLPLALVGTSRPIGTSSAAGTNPPTGTSRPVGSVLEGWPAHLVDIGALSDHDSRALLRRRHPELAAATARRVLDEAAGNPLALTELPGRLEDEHRRGVVPLPERLPLGERLEVLFAQGLRSLPEEAKRALLRTALDGAGTGALPGPVPGRDRAERVLGPIEASGLARLDPTGRLVFRHSLVRSAVIAAASEADRRAAHRTLARRLRADDPRRLLHEASAAEGPDERLAARLQEAGTRMAQRGGDAEGALLLDRAASLSSDAGDRVRRLTWAAVMSARGGRLAYAAKLVGELKRTPVPEDVAPLFAYAVVYVDQSHHVDFASSFSLLPTALAALTASGAPGSGGCPGPAFGDLVEQMFFKLLLASVYTGDTRGWETLERYREYVSPAARLCHRAWADPPRTAHGAEAELRRMVAHRTARGETGHAWLLLWAATAVDGGDPDLWRLSGGEHAYATQGSVAKARCHQDFLRGRWDTAGDCLREAETAEELGYHCNALLFRHYHAHFLAGRGDERGLREARARIEPVARRARMRFVTDHLDRLGALAALAHGRHEEAYTRLRGMMSPGDLPRGLSWFHLPFFDFVYAALRCGRRTEARAHVAAGQAARMGDISAHHAFLLAAATALTAGDDEADEAEAVGEADAAYAAACAVPGADRWVFDLARLRLAHGSRLLRQGRHTDAGDPLRAALTAFTRLGAAPWAEQCRSALRGADGSRDSTAAGPAELTAQELRIARLVATGLTNKEVGAALHLSPRTVGAHLYRAFPKLGITSRAALARALPPGRSAGSPPGPAPSRRGS